MDQIKVKRPFEIPYDGDELTRTARQKFDDDIYKLEYTTVSLKTKRNQLSPIYVLPAEVLSTIFIFARDESLRFWFSNGHSSWIRVTHVCHYWREVALGCPSLWAAPIFTKPGLSQEMLERSKMAALTIKSQMYAQWDSRVLRGLENAMGQIHRIESIELALYRIRKFKTIFPPLSRPAPLLETLSLLDGSMDGNQFSLPTDAFSDAPRLRSVELVRLDFSWESALFKLENLTKLWLTDNRAATDGTSSFSQMMDALHHLPNLRILNLNNCIPPHTTSNRDETILEFKFLHHLELRAEAVDCIFFLALVQYPPQTMIRLCSSSTTLDDSHNIFSLIGQNLYRTERSGSGDTHSPVLVRSLQLTYADSGAPEIIIFSKIGALTSVINITLDSNRLLSGVHGHHITSLCTCFNLSSLLEVSFDWDFTLNEINVVRDSFGKLPNLMVVVISRPLLQICLALIGGLTDPSTRKNKEPEKPRTRYPLRSRKSEPSPPPIPDFAALRDLIVTDQDFREHHPEAVGFLLDMLMERSNMNAPIGRLFVEQCRGMRTRQKRQLAELVVHLEVNFEAIDVKELDAVDDEDDDEDDYYSDEDEDESEYYDEDDLSDDPWNTPE